MIKIPDLKSKYIPVHSKSHILNSKIHWWKSDSPFFYPYVLINLDTIDSNDVNEMEIHKNNIFLLTDSGGFQAISGQYNLNKITSLTKQIELGATKIFSFDKPPVERVTEGLNLFRGIEVEKYKKQIEENLDIAIEQSKWLQMNYPEKVKDFCYVLHASSKGLLDYNIQLIGEKLGGLHEFKKYFGGVSYAIKKSDYIFFTTCAAHAKKHFIDNDIYCHFLGIGSFYKMIILIYFDIDTFDSSNALRGVMVWSMNSPLDLQIHNLNKKDFPFTKPFCICPVCSKVDYNKLIDEKEETYVGRWFIAHNLWQILKVNVFLDSLDKKNYTKNIRQFFKVNQEVSDSLDYINDIDKMGLDIAYEKWKHFLKKDETKQKGLF